MDTRIAELEAKIEEQQRRIALLEEAQETARIGSWEYELASGQVRWTRQVYDIHDLPLDYDLSMMRYTELYVAEDSHMLIQAIETSIQTGKTYNLELRVMRTNGELTWIQKTIKAYYHDDEPVRLYGTIQDIHQRKQAEQSLYASQQMLQTVLDAVPTRIFWKDTEGRFLGANRYVVEDAGLGNVAELIGKTDYDMPWKDQADVYRADDREVIASGQPKLNIIEPQTLKDGSTMWLRTSKVPMRNEAGEVIGILGTFLDITDQVEAEQERHRLQQQIIEAQQVAIAELSTPIIPVFEGVIIMPLIGHIDSMRARDIMRSLLAGITQHRARTVIMDITGVSIVDTGVANHLNKTIQAARLKGARAIITGMSDAVAETVVDLGIDWSDVETLRDLQTGLMKALKGSK